MEKTTISFGKIAYDRPNRKTNEAVVQIELRECKTNAGYIYTELSICGDIWNSRHTNIRCCGQCLDEIAEHVHTPLFREIFELWNKWHLNGLHAGTPEQEKAIKEWEAQGNKYDYDKACEHLKNLDLYAVCYTGHGQSQEYNNDLYVYGTDWIIRELPKNVIKRVKEIIKEQNKK